MARIYRLLGVMLLILLLSGCEARTFKGQWHSQRDVNGEFIDLTLDENNQFVCNLMVTDSTYSARLTGLWTEDSDTIKLYSQSEGCEELVIKQMSMDNMTLQSKRKFLIMDRQYTPGESRWYQVARLQGHPLYYLKEYVWDYVWPIVFAIVFFGMIIFVISSIIDGIKILWKKYVKQD